MKRWPTRPLGEFIEERTERLRGDTTTIYSVTNERGFVRSLDLFDKQVFSADTGNYKRVEFRDLAYNPSRINVGSIALCEDKNGGAVSPMYVIVRTERGLLPHYLLHFLKSDAGLHQIRHRCEGAVRFQLKFRDLCSIPIPLPPLAEQERVVKLLDEADELRKLRAQADRRAADLIPALFHEMFGDPATNPCQWPKAVLGDVIFAAQDGPHVSPKYSPNGVPFLSTRHVKQGQVIWEDLKFLSNEEATLQWKKCKPAKGDVLYTKGGTTGIAAAVTFDTQVAVWVHIALLKTNHEKVDPFWLENMLNSSFCYQQSQELTHGIANRDLGLKRMVKINMYLPPLPLQQEFAQRVSEIRELQATQAASRQRVEHLFQSMLHRAFNQAL